MKETEEFHQLREVTVICYGNQVNCTLKSKTHLKFRMFLFKFTSVNNRAGDGILNDPTGQQEHWLGADTGDMLYRAFKQLHVFPRFLTVSCFPRFVTATCFPVLSNILVFPTFSDSQHVFPRFPPIACYPARGTSYVMSHPIYVTCYMCLLTSFLHELRLIEHVTLSCYRR